MQSFPCSESSEGQHTTSSSSIYSSATSFYLLSHFLSKGRPSLFSFRPEWPVPWGSCAVSLQGSDGLQHALQLATLVELHHVAAASDAFLTHKHTWHLQEQTGNGSVRSTVAAEGAHTILCGFFRLFFFFVLHFTPWWTMIHHGFL